MSNPIPNEAVEAAQFEYRNHFRTLNSTERMPIGHYVWLAMQAYAAKEVEKALLLEANKGLSRQPEIEELKIQLDSSKYIQYAEKKILINEIADHAECKQKLLSAELANVKLREALEKCQNAITGYKSVNKLAEDSVMSKALISARAAISQSPDYGLVKEIKVIVEAASKVACVCHLLGPNERCQSCTAKQLLTRLGAR